MPDPDLIKFKRGTASQVAAITPAEGEPVWVTDSKLLRIGDGATPGGVTTGQENAATYTFNTAATSTIPGDARRVYFTYGSAAQSGRLPIIGAAPSPTTVRPGAEIYVVNEGAEITLYASDGVTVVAVVRRGETVLMIARVAVNTWKKLRVELRNPPGVVDSTSDLVDASLIDPTIPGVWNAGNYDDEVVVLSIWNMVNGQVIRLLSKNHLELVSLAFDTASGTTLKWPGGVQPTPTLANGKSDLYEFVKIEDTIYGRQLAANF